MRGRFAGQLKERDLLAAGAGGAGLGTALGVARTGTEHPVAKPWKGEGPGVLEIVSNFDGDTFRAVYTGRCRKRCMSCIALIRVAQWDSDRAADVDLFRARLKLARVDYEVRYGKTDH